MLLVRFLFSRYAAALPDDPLRPADPDDVRQALASPCPSTVGSGRGKPWKTEEGNTSETVRQGTEIDQVAVEEEKNHQCQLELKEPCGRDVSSKLRCVKPGLVHAALHVD